MECRFCQKSFSKGEHLRRHERSHTGSRPFACAICSRPFGRQDSLLRHERLHSRPRHSKSGLPSAGGVRPHPPTPESVHSSEGSEHHAADPCSSRPSSNQYAPGRQVTVGDAGLGALPASPPPPATTGADLTFDLIWPDSEDLFQSIISEAPAQWQVPLGTLPFPPDLIPTAPLSVGTPSSFDDRPASIGHIPSGGNHQAVHDVSSMIASLSSSVTAAVESTPVTSVFLDECLHMFFVKFIPVFPVLHRSTFVFRECTQALLLNAIAIGSLYLGPKSAVTKGEVLWRLAHTAVATSWQTLIAHRGPYDACQGVQLLVTALLGQVYGLLSRNRTIRTSSRAFHALAFYWANHCGMYESEPYSLASLPQSTSPKEEKERQWRIWVAREIQQRALLAHYTIDGLIAQMSGESTSVRHSANQLGLPSSEAAFAAETADEWLNLMQTEQVYRTSFRNIFRLLFSPVDDGRWLNYTLSAFSLRVLLEGYQSLISDCSHHDNESDGDENDDGEARAPAIGLPTKPEIRKALARAHDCIAQSVSLSTPERQELLLRWHALCLDALIPSTSLCRHLCRRHNTMQHLWPGAPTPSSYSSSTVPTTMASPLPPTSPAPIASPTAPQSNAKLWPLPSSPTARRALLHAAAIQDLVETLPRGRAHAVHMPASLFAAATVYAAFALRGIATVRLPAKVEWAVVLGATTAAAAAAAAGGGGGETERFVWGEGADGGGTGGVGIGEERKEGGGFARAGTARNLLYEFNSMQKLFRCLSTQWGIAFDMEAVVDQWNAICH